MWTYRLTNNTMYSLIMTVKTVQLYLNLLWLLYKLSINMIAYCENQSILQTVLVIIATFDNPTDSTL